MDQGNNTDNATADVWIDLRGLSPLSTSNTYSTSAVIAGTTYKMRVRALNKYGWGPFSNVGNIRAAGAPVGSAITITTANQTTSMRISWTAAFNNGLDITQY